MTEGQRHTAGKLIAATAGSSVVGLPIVSQSGRAIANVRTVPPEFPGAEAINAEAIANAARLAACWNACICVPTESLLSTLVNEVLDENLRLVRLLNTPEIIDFVKAVQLEAAHQRERWHSDHDAGKTPADWFWLIGYLAGKALHAQGSGNTEKALHHVITTAAALCNWHAAILGQTGMRPGIETPPEFAEHKPAPGAA